ncbi:MAG: ATP-binding protein, partial [Bacteroidota bacterium]
KRTDLNGLLLLISPPGYGKTTLMEYIANRLGIIFMKINGPALGHTITSLDPGEAPNATSKEELEKLNLAFEMGDNVMIYLDDIQHCNPELLQKFISLCDAQRKIEGVYKGRSKTYDFRGKKVCVIMAGNPYTESGEKFQIPDMLANRADIYNLGDIIGDTEDSFKLSYIENALTSNPILKKAAAKSHGDVIKMVKVAETGKQEGVNYEANHSQDEISECIELLKKVLQVRDVIYLVNKQYIASAAQADEYRVEPPFKLQGSYRDMNKIVEKLVPVMNDDELRTIIISHYQNESQTLTSGAEANILKFKELYNIITEEEKARWIEILETFMKSQRSKGYGENNQAGLMIEQMVSISDSLDGIKDEILKKMKVFSVAKKQRKA